MTTDIFDQLHRVGIDLALREPDRLVATPAERLNDDLRALIRFNKQALMEMLRGSRLPAIPNRPPELGHRVSTHLKSDWLPLAAEYHRHHWNCRTCQVAGQGRGLRCGAGMALWVDYQDRI